MALYGDLMTALTYTLFLPLYFRAYMSFETAPRHIAFLVCLEVITCALHWIAWARNYRRISVLAFLLQVVCFSSNTIFQWPYGTDNTLLPQFLWAITIHVSSNMDHTSTVKVCLILYALSWATFATLVSDSLETVPTLLICVTVSVISYVVQMHPQRFKEESMSARMATILLGAIFVHHLATEVHQIMLVPGYASTGGFNITKMGIVASMGIIATGAFRDQVSIKQSLQSLVTAKGDEMVRQAEKMEMISMAVEASETALAITDSDMSIIWKNFAMQRLINLRHDTQTKVTLIDAMGLSDDVSDAFRACFDTTKQKAMELNRNGRDIRIVVSPFISSKSLRFLVAMNDVSELRARERAEKAAEQAARTAMQESMETLTHELRTPLQGIIGMTSMVLENNDTDSPEETYKCMSTVMASSRILLTLINNLLDSHKLDAKMMDELQLSPVSLRSAMQDAANFCGPIAALNNIDPQLCIDFNDEEKVVVQTNPVRFQQVLVNLVSNAIKYAANGTIVLRAEVVGVDEANKRIRNAFATGNGHEQRRFSSASSKVAVISVEDSGDGIPPDMVDRVFQKFSQYSNPGKSYTRSGCLNNFSSGTGIGLNLCSKFVDRMGGVIWVTNKATKGACFSFCLPVVTLPDEFPATETKEETSCVPRPVNESQLRDRQLGQMIWSNGKSQPLALKVLVVDDTLINLKVLERMIRNLSASFQVTAASSGANALSELSRATYDLVITDIQMPLMDGIELCQAIRDSKSLNPKPIVVALTAETTESLHNRCSTVGISHILFKPISSHQFRSFFESTLHTLLPCDRNTR